MAGNSDSAGPEGKRRSDENRSKVGQSHADVAKGKEGQLQSRAEGYAKALEWRTEQPLEVHCDFVSTVTHVLKLAASTGNSAGLILVDPGRPLENIPGATRMGPDLEAALLDGEVRESFGVLPEDHFAVAVIGCSEDELHERASGLLRTCKVVGQQTEASNTPPKIVALHISTKTQLTGERLLAHAERLLAGMEPGEQFRLVTYLSSVEGGRSEA